MKFVGGIEFFTQLLLDHFRHQSLHRSAGLRHFAHQARADVGILVGGHHENGLQGGLELAVHQRHLQFVFVVADRPDAAQDASRLHGFRVLHHQPVKGVDANILQMRCERPQHLQPLGHAEHRALLRVAQDADHQFLKNLGAPLDQVEVPVGGRIKRAGIDSDAFVQSSSQEQAAE